MAWALSTCGVIIIYGQLIKDNNILTTIVVSTLALTTLAPLVVRAVESSFRVRNLEKPDFGIE